MKEVREAQTEKKGNICINIFTGQTVTQCLHCGGVYPADMKVSGVDERLAHTHIHTQTIRKDSRTCADMHAHSNSHNASLYVARSLVKVVSQIQASRW